MGELQQKRSELYAKAEKERQAEFLDFQREQAEINRQHEIKMVEIIMRYTNVRQLLLQQATNQMPQQPARSVCQYNGDMGVVMFEHGTNLTALDSPAPSHWYKH